jgi:hypothetical protein
MAKLEKFNMRQVLDDVKKEMIELTSLPFNTIVGVAQDEETHVPTVTIELVERKAIPDSMDLLGIYDVILDAEGTVKTFKRVGMRKRCDISAAGDF